MHPIGRGDMVKTIKTLALWACIGALLLPSLAAAQPAPFPLPRPADRIPAGYAPPADAATAAPAGEEDLPVAGEPGIAAAPAPADLAPSAAAAAEAIAIAVDPRPVVLTAKITESSDPITEGLVWRIFETRTDATGELVLATKTDDAMARLQLVPGQYVVHVAYGQAQATDTLQVSESGETDKAMVLDAGGMRLNAAITGDVSIPINLLRFDIFTSGSESERTLVAQDLSANNIVTLNAGTFHVVSYFGDINAVVRADLRVESGELTDATLYHRAAQIAFKLVTQAGGEAVADVEWTVKTANGETVFSNIGAFPATVLAEGDYLVLAKQGETVYSREFAVQPGQGREIEVLTTVY